METRASAKQAGVTLIELTMALAIAAILAGAATLVR
jgi:prepilin-type N-terminal cleavage/methylation domain-containing protein